MAIDASSGPPAAQRSGAGRPLPEADADWVERWRTHSGQLVDLLGLVRERLGGVAAFRLGPQPTILVTGPEAVQHVLALHPEQYVKRSHRARLLIGDGVLAATGEAWKRQRKLLQSQFTGKGMRRYEERIAGAVRTTAGRWADHARTGRTFDLGEEMRRFALDTIWRALTGHPLDDTTAHELTAVATVVAALPSLPADQVDARDAVADDLARIDEVARRAVAAARDGAPGPDGPGLLQVLVDASAERPEYTDRLVRDELVTLLVAGHETTATTLTWLYLLLDGHPAARGWALRPAVRARRSGARRSRRWSARRSGSTRPRGSCPGTPPRTTCWRATASKRARICWSAPTSPTAIPNCGRIPSTSTPGASPFPAAVPPGPAPTCRSASAPVPASASSSP